MESKVLYCKVCHVFITRYTQDKDGTQLFRNGQPAGAKYHNNQFKIKTKDGFMSGLPVGCSRHHMNFIPDTPEMIEEAERLKFNYGQLCIYHYNPKAICDLRMPCEECIVKRDYGLNVLQTRKMNRLLGDICEPIIPDFEVKSG